MIICIDWNSAIHSRDYISQDNPLAAIVLDDEFGEAAQRACARPERLKRGRVKGTREMVVKPHYILIYRVVGMF